MPTFTVTGDIEPFLHVSLRKGETIFCESDAMVMMEDPRDLTGAVQGGLMQAAMRPAARALCCGFAEVARYCCAPETGKASSPGSPKNSR